MTQPFFAKKSLGQNFLIQPQIIKDIVVASEIRAGETAVEIGPGTGLLTKELLLTGASVIAIEKDDRLIEILEETFTSALESKQLTLIHGDALKDIPALPETYRVIANIPYYITGKLIRLFLERTTQPISMTLLMQKEVAERIVSKDTKESLLSISVKAYGQPEYVRTVKAGNFRPEPKVDSAVLHIADISRKNFTTHTPEHFFSLVRAGFSSKRKKLIKNLKQFDHDRVTDACKVCNISEHVRAEDLRLEEWLCLAEHV